MPFTEPTFTDSAGHTWIMAALPLPETLEDVLSAWCRHGLAAGHSRRTIDSRTYTLRRLAREHDPLVVGHDDLLTWLGGLTHNKTGEPVPRSTKATYRAQLRAFFSWLQASGRRADNPAERLPALRPPRGLPRPLSPAAVQALLDACSDPRAWRTRAYVTLACYAGLRVHEIAKVRGEDIQGDVLRVLGKGGYDATVPLHPMVAELAARMPERGYWFSQGNGRPMHRGSVSAAIARAMRRAGVPGTPHACRHFFGTQVLVASGDVRKAQQAMRHQSIASTAIYTQVADDSVRAAVAAIPGPTRPAR